MFLTVHEGMSVDIGNVYRSCQRLFLQFILYGKDALGAHLFHVPHMAFMCFWRLCYLAERSVHLKKVQYLEESALLINVTPPTSSPARGVFNLFCCQNCQYYGFHVY